MTENHQLLADYVRTGSEAAFGELISRYTNLVYSAAVRLVGGNTQLAEDVTQTVFVDFARKAGTLPQNVMLGGWLHHHTIYVASNVMRAERRRQAREQEAVQMNAPESDTQANIVQVAPELDEAIEELGAEDRQAILLRFFEQIDFRSVGQALGSTEEAARKRVSRALEKLQGLLQRRGISLSMAALGTVLATETVKAAPMGLAANTAKAALAVAGAGAAGGFVQILHVTKLKLAVAGAIAIAGVAAPLAIQQRALHQQRRENQDLHQQLARLAAVAQENEQLSNLLTKANDRPSKSDPGTELLRLRDAERELAQLRRQSAKPASGESQAGIASPAGHAEAPRFIFVGGEVNTPGRFIWTNGMTLASVIELAHGYTEAAHRSSAQITDADGSSITINYGGSSEPVAAGEFIQPGVRVFIPRSDAGDGAGQ